MKSQIIATALKSETPLPVPGREFLKYGEYDGINEEGLRDYFLRNEGMIPSRPDGYRIVALKNDSVVGYLSCFKDHFDSANFKFACMQMSQPMIFIDGVGGEHQIIIAMLGELEREIREDHDRAHIRCGIGNAPLENNISFNSVTSAGFVYLQSLLTFVLPEGREVSKPPEKYDNLVIRLAVEDDATQVAAIALNSFRFSRYHMDPFLDNNIADSLLFNSARNSILDHFADIVFVAERNGKIVGYYSGKKRLEPAIGKIVGEAVISAVDQGSRRYGIFNKLDDHLLYWFSKNVDFAEMGTYLINTPIIRTWAQKNLTLIRGTHQFSKIIK